MTLAHDRSGSGEPLILLHGFGSRRQIWRPVLALLEPHREVIAVDLPGFGESPPLADRPTPARLAVAVEELIGELGLERPHVAGYSMGGWIALELGKTGSVRSVCAFCPAGFWNRWERAWCKGSLRNTRATLRLGGPVIERLFENDGARRALNRQTFEHADRLSADEMRAASRSYVAAPGFDATLEALHAGHFTGAGEVQPPFTVAWGDKDKLLLPRQAERARRALPQGRHLWLTGCNHHPMVDDPEATARAILTSAA